MKFTSEDLMKAMGLQVGDRIKVKSFLANGEDEIYTALEETCPIMTLMTIVVNGETWPQCCEAISPWNGKIVSLIPGHKPESTENPGLISNLEVLIDYLLK